MEEARESLSDGLKKSPVPAHVEDRRCPSCGSNSRPFTTLDKALLCPDCFNEYGYETYTGPEWKFSGNAEERKNGSRVGPPSTLLLHDRGLGTEISRKDFAGKPTKGDNLNSMILWQNRSRAYKSRDRTVAGGLARLNVLADKLNLTKSVKETAAYIYLKAMEKGAFNYRSRDGSVVACIYVADKKHGSSRTVKELVRVTGVGKKQLWQYQRVLVDYGLSEFVPASSVSKLIGKFSSISKIDPVVERCALDIAEKSFNWRLTQGKNPSGWAAAYLYIASAMYGLHIPQHEFAYVAKVTEATVRARIKNVLDNYGIKQILQPVKEKEKWSNRWTSP